MLAHAAERACADPFFLGHALLRYRQFHQLDEAAMAAALGVRLIDLYRLSLCRRPGEHFRQDVDSLAHRFDVAPGALASMLRQVDALTSLREISRTPALLLAARDQDLKDPEDER